MKKCPKCGREYEDANTLCPSDGAVLQRDGDELLGQTLIGKYRIEEKISEGGMGTVYRGTHVLMEKIVAVKVLHPALAADDKIVARFTREAKAASRISHPHAIIVTDFGETETGVVFLVMEYLRGRTLKQVVRSDGPMTLARASEIIRQVCGALDAAHAEGVVHRDLKSDNIMLDESPSGDWAKVLDFGIAKIIEPEGTIDPELTAPNLIIGTPQYMSPEQCAQASEIDARSDIYSLGVIVYEMLAGHVPFTGDSPTAIMMKHIQEPPPSLLEERDDLPPSVARVVERALAKRPEDRYKSAGELAEAVAQAAIEKSSDVASSATAAGLAAANTDGQTPPGTNRIVVTTGENKPVRSTTNDEYDETTVVHARTRAQGEEVVSRPAPPPPAPGFNPWKIALPAIAALVLVFGAFYAFRGNESSAEDGTPPLVADPNSQPVESAAPATGDAERSLTPSTNSNAASPGSPGDTTTPLAADANANVAASPTPSGDDSEAGENSNSEGEEEEAATPQPTPTPRKAPTPPIDTSDDPPAVRPPAPATPEPKASPPSAAPDVPSPVIPDP
ncbi:MAG TPA: protein kinase [Pyrinomonadaceae bacterium]|nr:protein kinase [Pyrinomonadaceae bacterium]